MPILEKRSNMPRVFLGVFLSLLAACFLTFFSSSCRLYRLERRLDPVNAEFLSKVRYIITRKERKIFLELPASEKEAFQEEFWKIRDPDPETEENEFKMMYFERIETSNELFVSEGRPGWLTDRGRIYVLFGPPWDRITYPMGSDPWSRCQEIWYYGGFPVLFIDSTCTGQYKLVTYDLTALRNLNLMYMHEFSKAQDRALEAPKKAREFFDFNWRVKKEIIAENRAEGIIEIEIPYEGIWFNAEDDMLKTVLDVRLELKDFEANIIWEYEEAFEIVIKDDELREKKGKKYKIEIPFILNEELDRLRLGQNFLYAVVLNRTGNEEAKKVMEFRLELANR
ncbi:MAG: GWxTD domain-containing protein [Candidatus Aminicenantes bacterium]|nr:GWxTD domain-containing protein [Candidatus Aminicenantes bacterium]